MEQPKTIEEILIHCNNRVKRYDTDLQCIAEAKQALAAWVRSKKPNSDLLSTTANKPEVIFGFDMACKVFEQALLTDLEEVQDGKSN